MFCITHVYKNTKRNLFQLDHRLMFVRYFGAGADSPILFVSVIRAVVRPEYRGERTGPNKALCSNAFLVIKTLLWCTVVDK